MLVYAWTKGKVTSPKDHVASAVGPLGIQIGSAKLQEHADMQLLQERDENRFLSSIVVREPGDVIITLHGSDDSVIGQFTLKRAEGRGQPWGPLRLAGTGMSQANETIIRNWVGIAWPVE